MINVNQRRLALALLSLRSNPPFNLIVTFVMGILLTALVGNFLFSLIMSPESITTDHLWRFLLAVVVLFWIAAGNYTAYVQGIKNDVQVLDSPQVEKKQYVITAISPLNPNVTPKSEKAVQNVEVLINLAAFHRPVLRRMYLIGTFSNEPDLSNKVDEAYETLQDYLMTHLEIENVDKLLQKVPIRNSDTNEDVFRAVQVLVMSETELSSNNTVIDVTAGTKAMTVGLTLAGMLHHCMITYHASERDETGQPKVGGRKTLHQLQTDLNVIAPLLNKNTSSSTEDEKPRNT